MLTRSTLIAGLLLLSACSFDPKDLHQQQLSQANTPLANNLAEALQQSTPVPLQLDSLRALKSPINEHAPRVLLNEQPSNYRTFSVTLRAGEPYNLHVISDCISCSGTARYGINPLLFLLDEQGQVVNQEPSDTYSGTHGVTLRLTGTAPYDGTFYLLVAADNRNLGQEIQLEPRTEAPTLSQNQQRLPMRSYPVGAIRVYANTRI